MIELLTLLVVIILLGALAGGNSFGEVVRTGCGCLGFLILLIAIGIALMLFPVVVR